MDALLQEITALPKVLGCFVYSGNQGVTSSNMPPIFTKNTVQIIGTLLSKPKQMGKVAKLDIESIDIRYNETVIVAQPLNNNSVLVTICEPGTNRPLLDMSIKMVLKELQQQLQPGKQSAPLSAGMDNHRLGSLKPVLAKINEALADVIGPIAKPVLTDSLKKWSGQGPQTKERLPDLAMMICKEIDDEQLEANFMDNIKQFF